jgi:hypothetical protein
MISTYAHNKHRESHPLISDYAASSVLTGSMHTCTLTTYDSIQRQNHTHIRTYTPWPCVRDAHVHILDAHTPTRRGHTRRGPTQQSSRAHTRDAFISNSRHSHSSLRLLCFHRRQDRWGYMSGVTLGDALSWDQPTYQGRVVWRPDAASGACTTATPANSSSGGGPSSAARRSSASARDAYLSQ